MKQGAEKLSEIKALTQKRTDKRVSFLQSIVDRIEEAIYSECLSEDRISETIEYKDGWIEIYMKNDGTKEVMVCHSDNEHESPRLEATIAGMLPNWWAVRAEAEDARREEQDFQDFLWRECRYW